MWRCVSVQDRDLAIGEHLTSFGFLAYNKHFLHLLCYSARARRPAVSSFLDIHCSCNRSAFHSSTNVRHFSVDCVRARAGAVRGQNIWGAWPLPFPPFPLLFPFPPSPLHPFRSRPLGPLNTARGLGAPPAGSGTEPQRKSNCVHFILKF